MRQIEAQMLNAAATGRDWQKDNTSVSNTDHGIVIRLHGHPIARLCTDDQLLWITDAGWQTNTTKSRLNALLSQFCPGCGIHQKDFVWYLTRRDYETTMNRRELYAVSL